MASTPPPPPPSPTSSASSPRQLPPPAPASLRQLPPLQLRRAAPLAFTLMGAAFINVPSPPLCTTMSIQALVIALPSIAHDLRIPPPRLQWVVSAYSITFATFLLVCGRLGDVYGRRRVFLGGGAWVAATALGTAFCPTEVSFVVLRALQGLGAAANVPAAIGILGASIPPGRVKNYSFAIYSAGAPLGAVVGNLVGGILTQYADWKWIFYVLAIASALIVAVAWFVIPTPAPAPAPAKAALQIDWLGAFLSTSALVALIFALSDGPSRRHGWSQPHIIALLALSLLLAGAFLAWQRHLEAHCTLPPLLRPSLFRRHRTLSAAMAVTLFFWAAFNNYMIYATYFYQPYLGLSPIATTLRFLPTGIAGLLTTAASGYLLGRAPAAAILALGTAATATACLLMALPIPPAASYWAYGFPAMVLAVVGADTVYPCLALYTTSAMPRADQALAGGVFNTVAQVGRAVGLALATVVDEAVRGHGRRGGRDGRDGRDGRERLARLLSAIRAAQWVNFALAVVALAVAVVGLRRIGKVGRA
ncbi:drug resistance protein [Geopyxis carbonaria]|nr:drug resistance protein [Geopyxis carbonaria]